MKTKSLISLMLLFQAIINGVNPAIPPDRQSTKCSKNGNLNSDKLKERDFALDGLYTRYARPPYTGDERSTGDGIWVTGLCPTNIKMEDCRQCVKDTIPVLKKNCPKEKEGATWSVLPRLYCMVRYADNSDQGNLGEWAWATFSTIPNKPPAPATAGDLEKGLNNLANTLNEKTNEINNIHRYASGSISYGPGSHTLYGSMHCAPGISKVNCVKCLSDATNRIHNCCSKLRKQSGRVFSVNCAFWYSHMNFLPATLSTISTPSSANQDP